MPRRTSSLFRSRKQAESGSSFQKGPISGRTSVSSMRFDFVVLWLTKFDLQ